MTSSRKRDVAIFFAGAMAWHALTHLVLAILKSEEAHEKLGIRMTPARNTAAAGFWAAVALFLTRCARKQWAFPMPSEPLPQN